MQDEAGGIAQALSLGEDFVGKVDSVAVILGDNIFEDTFDVSDFKWGAKLFLKKSNTPERFGVAQVANDTIISIVEKPKAFVSDLVVTGLYIYDWRVFSIIKKLKPSARGELEITDVNNQYLQIGEVPFQMVSGEWTDAGTFESLFRANALARKMTHGE
jgi:glucose-1-phosphate thymidylyltransferase